MSDRLFHQVPVFTGLDTEALQLLTARMQREIFQEGDLVVEEGSLGDTLYLVEAGLLDVVLHLHKPHEVVLSRLQHLDFFGEMSIIEATTRSASVRATEDATTLYSIQANDLFRLFSQRPDQFSILILNIARDISRRLRKVEARL